MRAWLVALVALSACARDLTLPDPSFTPRIALPPCEEGSPCEENAVVSGTVKLRVVSAGGAPLTGVEYAIVGYGRQVARPPLFLWEVPTQEIYPDGAGLLIVTATPLWKADQPAPPATFSFRVDNRPTAITITSPAPRQTYRPGDTSVGVAACVRLHQGARFDLVRVVGSFQVLGVDGGTATPMQRDPSTACAPEFAFSGSLPLQGLPTGAYDDLRVRATADDDIGSLTAVAEVPVRLTREVGPVDLGSGAAPYGAVWAYESDGGPGVALVTGFEEAQGVLQDGGAGAKWGMSNPDALAVSDKGTAAFSCGGCAGGSSLSIGGGRFEGPRSLTAAVSRPFRLAGAVGPLSCVGAENMRAGEADVFCYEAGGTIGDFIFVPFPTSRDTLGWIGVAGESLPLIAVLLRFEDFLSCGDRCATVLTYRLSGVPNNPNQAVPIKSATLRAFSDQRTPASARADRFGAVLSLHSDPAVRVVRTDGTIESRARPNGMDTASALAVGPDSVVVWRAPAGPEQTAIRVTRADGTQKWTATEPYPTDTGDWPDGLRGLGTISSKAAVFDAKGTVYISASVRRPARNEGHVFAYNASGERQWAWHGAAVRAVALLPSNPRAHVYVLDDALIVHALAR